MSDEEFQILTQSLAQKNFGGRVVAADRLRQVYRLPAFVSVC